MAYGPFSSNKIQLGQETTAGTAVAADIVWRGPAADIEETSPIVMVEESVGLLVPTGRSYVPLLSAVLSIPETEATFEHLPHIFTAGIKTVTPSGGGPYTYGPYAPGVSSANTIKTYTLETGNAIAGDGNEMEYGFVESFTLSGKVGEAWKVSSNWRGRQKTAAAMTGALSLTTLEEILFGNTKLYIDATGGTIGSTQKSGVLLEASVQVNTGIQAVFAADGSLYFVTHKFTPPSLDFTLTMEVESGTIVAAERAFLRSQVARLIRLIATGTSDREFTIDLAGKYTSVGGYQNSNGNTTVQLSGSAVYSSADSLFFSFSIDNNLSTLP
ncbi:MAG: hypothetical protein KF753_04990 [Caldilineaceae bacterium]|nr:hypothetical protein [Caldilineaceae bacterium]